MSAGHRDAVTASMLLPWTVDGPFPGQRETKKRHGFAAYANIVNRLGIYVAQGFPPEVAAGIVEAVNYHDRLRDIVRRLADIVRHDCDERAMSVTREAYAALGEEVPE